MIIKFPREIIGWRLFEILLISLKETRSEFWWEVNSFINNYIYSQASRNRQNFSAYIEAQQFTNTNPTKILKSKYSTPGNYVAKTTLIFSKKYMEFEIELYTFIGEKFDFKNNTDKLDFFDLTIKNLFKNLQI
jgi:hypothetical protein